MLARISHKFYRKDGLDIDSDWKNDREHIIHTDKASGHLFQDESIDGPDFLKICEKCGLGSEIGDKIFNEGLRQFLLHQANSLESKTPIPEDVSNPQTFKALVEGLTTRSIATQATDTSSSTGTRTQNTFVRRVKNLFSSKK